MNFGYETEVNMILNLECSECGNVLEVDWYRQDNDELDIKIKPCKGCVKEIS